MLSYRVFSPDGKMTFVRDMGSVVYRWTYCRDSRPGWQFMLSTMELRGKYVPSIMVERKRHG